MAELNIERILEGKLRGSVNPRYDLSFKHIEYLLKRNWGDPCKMLSDSFVIGYVQGHKAALAEQKRKAVR